MGNNIKKIADLSGNIIAHVDEKPTRETLKKIGAKKGIEKYFRDEKVFPITRKASSFDEFYLQFDKKNIAPGYSIRNFKNIHGNYAQTDSRDKYEIIVAQVKTNSPSGDFTSEEIEYLIEASEKIFKTVGETQTDKSHYPSFKLVFTNGEKTFTLDELRKIPNK